MPKGKRNKHRWSRWWQVEERKHRVSGRVEEEYVEEERKRISGEDEELSKWRRGRIEYVEEWRKGRCGREIEVEEESRWKTGDRE